MARREANLDNIFLRMGIFDMFFCSLLYMMCFGAVKHIMAKICEICYEVSICFVKFSVITV